MRRFLAFSFSMMLTLAAAPPGALALGEKNYVSIKEMRENLPERWTGEYVINKGDGINRKAGDMVSVDVPIVVPEVDRVPVVRITWEPPVDVEELDESLDVAENEWSAKVMIRDFSEDDSPFPLLEANVTFDPALPWEDAPAIAVGEMKKWLPFMKDTELTCYLQQSCGISADNGFQRIFYYKTYHGIPQLVGGCPFTYQVESELGPKGKEVPSVPLGIAYILIKRPGQFWVVSCSSKEVGVDIEDIPLLPFEEILKVLEQRVRDGYAYSLNEVRFGYMAFIDPKKKGEEFLLMPIWAAKGRTRISTTIPFDLKTDQAVLDRGGYGSDAILLVNAQTGGTFDFLNDVRPERLHVPHIITWDEVK